jgi:hypothetical protein
MCASQVIPTVEPTMPLKKQRNPHMTRSWVARLLAWLACFGFLGTAGLHSTGYGSVSRLAADVPGVMGQVMPALWLIFSIDLAVLGLIVGVLAFRKNDVARPILVIAAACPLSAAGLQIRFIGFIPPTALLICLGALAVVAAATWPPGTAPRTVDPARDG